MKRFTHFLFAFLLLVGCNDNDNDISGKPVLPEKPDTQMTLEIPEQMETAPQGGNLVIPVHSNTSWTAYCKEKWLTPMPDHGYCDGEVVLKILPHHGIWDREATILFKTEKSQCPLLVRQKGIANRAIRIDKNGTANCFIASPDQKVCTFKAVIPNGSKGARTAVLVWQSTRELITRVEYSPSGGMVGFILHGKSGNAVIAVKDKNGTILWSWHIWITDFNPNRNTLTTNPNANGTSWTFMDRNLGALTSTSGDLSALGLIYQWGRKDPFPGVASVDEKEPETYDIEGNILRTTPETAAQYGTIELSVSHPDTFYKISYKTNDWTSPSDDDLWGGVSFKKSIYDPCPAGWKVPTCDKHGATPYDFILDGKAVYSVRPAGYFYDKWWFPCAGTRVYESGILSYNIGDGYGGMWIGTAGKSNPDLERYPALYGQYLFLIEGSFFKISKDSRSQGMSIRCVKE